MEHFYDKENVRKNSQSSENNNELEDSGVSIAPPALQLKSNQAMQLKGEEEEESMQLKKNGALQMKGEEEEESMQLKKNAAVQMKGEEEEESMQLKKNAAVQMKGEEEEESMQLKKAYQFKNIGEEEKVSNASETTSGLPSDLKENMESMSGHSLDDVNVHKNSDKPSQVGALAYAQGSDIHLGPGQDEHLAHEAWHVVQQKQGRVEATTQAKGLPVNDNASLEREADVMGDKAKSGNIGEVAQQKKASSNSGASAAQMKKSNTTYKSLPETLGPTQEGEIAVKGKGDDHAFSANDINQGSLGNCYLLASLAAIANSNPDLLDKAIKKNDDGTYTVKLYSRQETGMLWWKKKKLKPHYVTIYPRFPVAVDSKDTASEDADKKVPHAHGGDKDEKGQAELWVRLFEKAYALLVGSYDEIGQGEWPSVALEALTGIEYTPTNVGSGTKARIIKMMKKGQYCVLTTQKSTFEKLSKSDKKWARDRSLVAGHAYTVMKADKSKITVRNPWGSEARMTEIEMTWDQFYTYFDQFSKRD